MSDNKIHLSENFAKYKLQQIIKLCQITKYAKTKVFTKALIMPKQKLCQSNYNVK
jgi:hypothetical protein